MVRNNGLGFEPLESPKLNETFNKTPVINVHEKYESLVRWGINPDFAEQLDKMFAGINASTSEIMAHKGEIMAANNRVENQSELSRYTKTNLAMMKNSA